MEVAQPCGGWTRPISRRLSHRMYISPVAGNTRGGGGNLGDPLFRPVLQVLNSFERLE